MTDALKPQDVVVVLKLCAAAKFPRPSMNALGLALGMSSSEVHGAIRRARLSGLLRFNVSSPIPLPASRPPGLRFRFRSVREERPNVTAIVEFLVHGLKYVFPPRRGELTRGVATSYAAPPLNAFIARGDEPIPVWPFPEGTERGVAFEPLYPTVPFAALHDPSLYELLIIADALREGRVRERKIAERELRLRLEVISDEQP